MDDELSNNLDTYYGTQYCSRTLSIKLEYNTLAKIDYLLKHCKFPNRSDFIRKAIMYKINQVRRGG
ncbi:MAG: ribbon-helix-helix domain-containing protein [Sulfolobales archaeon]